MRVGVFDSGVGGESVVKAIEKALPNVEVLYAEDKKNVPYGTKTPEKLFELVLPILNTLSKQGCDVIVVACNTVTTTIIDQLRRVLPLPIIGMEPMVKPASKMTKSNIIAVCATPTTLGSPRYQWLKQAYAKGIKIIEPDCSDWAYLIETKTIDRSHIQKQISTVCEAGADVVVLGCTHYHWIEDIIKQIAGQRAVVLQPELAVVSQLKRVLAQLA